MNSYLNDTGANHGIGFNLARALGEHGWKVFGSVRPQTFAAGDETVDEVGSKWFYLSRQRLKIFIAAEDRCPSPPDRPWR